MNKALEFFTAVPRQHNCAQSVAAGMDREDLVPELAACGGGSKSGFRETETGIITNAENTIGGGITFNFISFNYTAVLVKSMDPPPTTFIVSQRTSSLLHADLILVMDEGTLVGKGNHEELMASCQTYREIYSSQFEGGEAK